MLSQPLARLDAVPSAARSGIRERPPLGRSTSNSSAAGAHSASLTNDLLISAIYHTACGFVWHAKPLSSRWNGVFHGSRCLLRETLLAQLG
jgi:hypothetical protein